MNLRNQRRIAAEVLKVGQDRVTLKPDRSEEISEAITREDVRILVNKGAITVKPVRGVSRGRARKAESQRRKGRRRGHGSRKGTSKAREPKKRAWIKRIRSIRDELQKLRAEGKIDGPAFRKLYSQAKGNLFHGRRHLREHIDKKKQ